FLGEKGLFFSEKNVFVHKPISRSRFAEKVPVTLPLPRLGRWQPQPLAPVPLRPNRLPPPTIREIPRDCFAQPAVETFLRSPAQFTPDLGDIHRVAPVVSWPICDKGDQTPMRSMRGFGQHFVEQETDRRY